MPHRRGSCITLEPEVVWSVQHCSGGTSLPASRTVLVVEDEIILLIEVVDFLRGCGFDVIACHDAAQALAILETSSPIDIVFSDIQLPGVMDGLDLARWILGHRPELKVILTSGSADALRRAADICDYGTVPKPYEYNALAMQFSALFRDDRDILQ